MQSPDWNGRRKDLLDTLPSPLPGPVELAERNELRAILLGTTPDPKRMTGLSLHWDSDRLERAVLIERLASMAGHPNTRRAVRE